MARSAAGLAPPPMSLVLWDIWERTGTPPDAGGSRAQDAGWFMRSLQLVAVRGAVRKLLSADPALIGSMTDAEKYWVRELRERGILKRIEDEMREGR